MIFRKQFPSNTTAGAFAIERSTDGITFTTVVPSTFGMSVDLPTSPFTNLQVNGEVILLLAQGEIIRLVNVGDSTLHLADSIDGEVGS